MFISSMWDVKESTHFSKRVGREVSRCCACPLCCSFWVGASHRDNLKHLPPLDINVQEKWLCMYVTSNKPNFEARFQSKQNGIAINWIAKLNDFSTCTEKLLKSHSFSIHKAYFITDQTNRHFLYDSLNIKSKVQVSRVIKIEDIRLKCSEKASLIHK